MNNLPSYEKLHATYINVDYERASMPAQSGGSETVLLALPPLAVIEADRGGHPDLRRRTRDAPAVYRGPKLLAVRKPARLPGRYLCGVAKAERTLRERAPSEELARAGECAVVVVADHDGYDGAVLQLWDDGGEVGLGRVRVDFAHEHGRAGSGRVGEEGLERRGDLFGGPCQKKI